MINDDVYDVYEGICSVAKSDSTDFNIGFDVLFQFMKENPDSKTTEEFIEYHIL